MWEFRGCRSTKDPGWVPHLLLATSPAAMCAEYLMHALMSLPAPAESYRGIFRDSGLSRQGLCYSTAEFSLFSSN